MLEQDKCSAYYVIDETTNEGMMQYHFGCGACDACPRDHFSASVLFAPMMSTVVAFPFLRSLGLYDGITFGNPTSLMTYSLLGDLRCKGGRELPSNLLQTGLSEGR